MKVVISHQEEMRFEALTQNASFIIDAPVISPLEYFLSGLLCCSATDMINVPQAKGVEIKNLQVTGEAVRNEELPKYFKELHITYTFDSSASDEQAIHWVEASIQTYCSTINTVRNTTRIVYTIIHNGTTVASQCQAATEVATTHASDDVSMCQIN